MAATSKSSSQTETRVALHTFKFASRKTSELGGRWQARRSCTATCDRATCGTRARLSLRRRSRNHGSDASPVAVTCIPNRPSPNRATRLPHVPEMAKGQAASVSLERRFVRFITRLPGFYGSYGLAATCKSSWRPQTFLTTCSASRAVASSHHYLAPTELPSFWLIRVLVLGRGAATLSASAFPAEPRSSLSLSPDSTHAIASDRSV